jgi:ferredoxin
MCLGCGWCAVICPEGVLALRNEIVVMAVAPEQCVSCVDCEDCPEKAISVDKS